MLRWMLCLTIAAMTIQPVSAAETGGVQVRKIWDAGNHNAFTDLLRWKDRWWCTFRESDGHVGGDGNIRVLTSADGEKWESAALIAEKDVDLRDPKMSITPKDQLMIVVGGSIYLGTTALKGRQPRVMFSSDGKEWTAPKKVLAEGDWLWRVTWNKKIAYGVSYNTIKPDNAGGKAAAASGSGGGLEWTLKLYSSTDGLKWTLVSPLEVSGKPNETTVRFLDDGRMMLMVRREALSKKGWVGVAAAPFTRWTWHESNYQFGGPNFIQLPDGSLVAGTRDYSGKGATTLVAAMSKTGQLTPIATLPSAKDNSYPGLVWRDGTLWVSYYSTHEGKTNIYLAKLPMSVAGAAPQRQIAIDNVCAWPNLTLMGDGSVNASIFGMPSHGQLAGAAECWNSADGQFWTKRGVPAPNDPNTNRMNLAAGLVKNGDLLVLCSGWTNEKQPQRPKQPDFRDDILSAWVCRSADGGKSWTQIKNFPEPDKGWTHYIPFGDIKIGEDGALHVSCYGGEFVDPAKSTKTRGYRSWHFRSNDDGKTWHRTAIIGKTSNETTLLHLGGKRWLAAAREAAMDLFFSDDDGNTWGEPLRVTEKNEINGHLLRLTDGRILLTYGSRRPGVFGVLAKTSDDAGKTWSTPVTLVDDALNGDCGYPSSVQMKDGRVLTAYYARGVPDHQRYHMGTVLWSPAPRAAK